MVQIPPARSVISDQQPNSPASKEVTDQPPDIEMVLPSTSTTGPSTHHKPVSDEDLNLQPNSHLSPTGFMEEDGELSDQDASVSSKKPDQQLSEEQKYRDTVKGVRLFMGWH